MIVATLVPAKRTLSDRLLGLNSHGPRETPHIRTALSVSPSTDARAVAIANGLRTSEPDFGPIPAPNCPRLSISWSESSGNGSGSASDDDDDNDDNLPPPDEYVIVRQIDTEYGRVCDGWSWRLSEVQQLVVESTSRGGRPALRRMRAYCRGIPQAWENARRRFRRSSASLSSSSSSGETADVDLDVGYGYALAYREGTDTDTSANPDREIILFEFPRGAGSDAYAIIDMGSVDCRLGQIEEISWWEMRVRLAEARRGSLREVVTGLVGELKRGEREN